MYQVNEVGDDVVERAAGMDDVDEAAASVQAVAGITDGGVAGLCLDREGWPGAGREERLSALRGWLAVERRYADQSARPGGR